MISIVSAHGRWEHKLLYSGKVTKNPEDQMSNFATLFLVSVASLVSTTAAFAADGADRYVILSRGAGLENLKSHAVREGGALEEDLVYHPAFTARMNAKA